VHVAVSGTVGRVKYIRIT